MRARITETVCKNEKLTPPAEPVRRITDAKLPGFTLRIGARTKNVRNGAGLDWTKFLLRRSRVSRERSCGCMSPN